MHVLPTEPFDPFADDYEGPGSATSEPPIDHHPTVTDAELADFFADLDGPTPLAELDREPPTAAPVTVPEPRAEPPKVDATAPAGREPEREVDYRMAVMDAPGLSIGARYTGVVIARHCWKTWELFAGSDSVAEWIGLKRTSHKTAGRYMDELAAAGFLDAFGKAGRATKYRLRLPA